MLTYKIHKQKKGNYKIKKLKTKNIFKLTGKEK